ncbi:MAG: hypothetical protein NW241_15505 [Bacteroidia bacterium]|nr:hypothetical protein [Bacteroidia bacterium]
MADFHDIRQIYTGTRRDFMRARREEYLERQQVLILEREIGLLLASERRKQLPSDHPKAVAYNQATKRLTDVGARRAQAEEALSSARKSFLEQGDVRRVVHHLEDDIPILLLPLKLQTRFLTVKHIARNCPDELLVDVATITNPSLRSRIRSLLPDQKPGADTLRGISAQQALLSNSDDPAALQLIRQMNTTSPFSAPKRWWRKVEDRHELFLRIFPDDIFMQTHETALTTEETASARDFWRDLWAAALEFHQSARDEAARETYSKARLAAWRRLNQAHMPHRAAWLARAMRPMNFPDVGPATDPEPKFPDAEVKSEAWTLPPRAELLPEQFAVRLVFNNAALPAKEIIGAPVPESLQLGLDPDEADTEAFAEQLDSLRLPAAIRWLTDFEEAERIGMAIRTGLSKAEVEAGIAKVIVLGVKVGADSAEGARLLEELFDNHRFRTDGMAFLPPGTPTNNLPGMPSGFSRAGLSPEQTLENELPEQPTAHDPDSDGGRFACALGLRPEAAAHIFNHQRRECSQALSLNRALWPGTLGYFLDQMMRPAIKTADISFARDFFQNFVAGRGLTPPFRVGKQPYGLVPASAWSLWQAEAGASREEKRMVRLLKKLDGEWQKLSTRVKTIRSVFSQQDEQAMKQQFRELLSVQASSTRFFRRLVAGEYLIWNLNKRNAPAGTEKAGVKTTPAEYKTKLESAAAWGEAVNPVPRILGRFLDDQNYKLTDFQPFEQQGPNARIDDDKNYLSLLLDATFEQLRDRQFGDAFGNFVKHRSSRLAFYVARFSILQAWIDAATQLLRQADGKISPFARLDFETEYLAVMIGATQPSEEHKRFLETAGEAANVETRKNKWAFFEEVLGAKRVADLIQEKISATPPPGAQDPIRTLYEVRQALADLSGLSDEQLERLLSEHLDLCSFRLDAWLQGLALARLSNSRSRPERAQGLFLGAFGYLENLRPSPDAWVRVEEVRSPAIAASLNIPPQQVVMPVYDFSGLTAKQKEQAKRFSFVYLGSDPRTRLVEDPLTHTLIQQSGTTTTQAAGFLLTPSAEHAATAAILRAGYEHYAQSQGPESRTLSVDLSPERTGRALDMLRAVQAGHSLNEQLGYFIERAMYESQSVSLAEFVLQVRERFPLQVELSEWDNDQQIGDAKIKNLALVTDGLRLVTEKNEASSGGAGTSSWNSFLSAVFDSNAARNAFTAIVEQAGQLFDALSDLLLAESVYQTVKGSPERAAAALRIAGEGAEITLPEISNMPLQSHLLTHRMGFVQKAAAPAAKPWPTAGPVSFWAQLSPDLNRWLADQLPVPGKICAVVVPESGDPRKVSLAALGLQAIDLYYMLVKASGSVQQSLLPRLFLNAAALEERAPAEVRFGREALLANNEFSIRELMPLLDNLGRLLVRSRPMRPADWQIQAGNTPSATSGLIVPQALAEAVKRLGAETATAPIPAFLGKLEEAIYALRDNQPVGFPGPETEAAFFHLFQLLPEAFLLGVWDAAPVCPEACTALHVAQLLEQATHVAQKLRARLAQAARLSRLIQQRAGQLSREEQFDAWAEAARVLAGEDLLILPRFRLETPAEIRATHDDADLLDQAGDLAVEEWLQGVATVRDNARNYLLLQNLREFVPCPAGSRSLKIMQLPFLADRPNRWVGAAFPAGYEPPQAATSLAYEVSGNLNPEVLLSGIVVDEWKEQIPLRDLSGAAAIHYDQPNQEAPQALLLAVAPQLTGRWQWPVLMKIVEETFELAKKRGVDTELLQETWLSQFLPALLGPLDPQDNTATLDFGLAGPPVLQNNHIVDGPGNVLIKTE